MKKILVTGGTGFLGKHFLESVKDLKYEFYVISRKKITSKQKNIHYLKGDLSNETSLKKIKRNIQGSEILIDLASIIPKKSSNEETFKDLENYMKHNVSGHIHLLSLLNASLKKIILASTIDIYGPLKEKNYSENHPTSPQTYYGASKLAMEHIFKFHCEQNGIQLTTLRFSQIYGPGDTPKKVIPIFIEKILNNKPITVFGSGTDKRSFLYCKDAVQAIQLALQSKKTGTYNVAGKENTSVNEIIKHIENISGKKAHIQKKPLQSKKSATQNMNTSKIRKELNFRAQTSIQAGIKETIQSSLP